MQAHPLNVAPALALHPEQAKQLQVVAGQIVKVGTAAGKATLPVVLDKRVALGTVWIETGHGATVPIGAGRVTMVAV